VRVLALGNMYPPHLLGGYEVICQGALRHARARGHEARVLTTGFRRRDVPPGAPEDPDVHRELDWYWREHEWRRLGPRATLALERANAAVFDRHLAEFAPDVIAWWSMGGMSLGLIERARRRGLPAVFFLLDYWLSYGRERDRWHRAGRRLGPLSPLLGRLTGLPARVRWGDAGRWVFCSETMRRNTLALGLGIPDGPVLTPGVEEALARGEREDQPPDWRWRLLYLGRVVPGKGVHTAVEALARLPARARLEVVGEGDAAYRRRLERRARELGVAERVTFLPARPREQLADVYRRADAVLFPVVWPEPWGLVPLEAMAVGRPVIATGRGGSGDYLRGGENSLLFPAEDPAALAAAVSALADDPELRARLRRGGYETAARHREGAFNQAALAELESAAGDQPRSR